MADVAALSRRVVVFRRRWPSLDSLAVALLGIALWQVASSGGLVASPGVALRSLAEGFATGWIIPHLVASLSLVLGSTLIGCASGVLGGIFLGTNANWSRVFSPMMVWAYAVPKVVLYPLVLVALGVNWKSPLAVASIAAFFPVVMNTTTAVQAINPTYLKVAHSLHAQPVDILRHVYLPALRGPLMVGFRLAWSISFVTIVTLEMVVAPAGLGMIMFQSYSVQNIPRMTAVLLLGFLLALLGNAALRVSERDR